MRRGGSGEGADDRQGWTRENGVVVGGALVGRCVQWRRAEVSRVRKSEVERNVEGGRDSLEGKESV